jgi:carboxypeptidase T
VWACLPLALFLHAVTFANTSLPIELEERHTYLVRVYADEAGRDWLAGNGFDIAGKDLAEGWFEIIADKDELELIRDEKLQHEILDELQRPIPLAVALSGGTSNRAPPTDPLADTLYTDNAELFAFLQQVIADHPDIARLEEIGLSIQGRSIWAMMISDNAALDEDELTVLFNSQHHPREVMTAEVVMDIIDHLTDSYGVDPEITAMVDSYQIWCVPVVNPDGLEIVFNQDHYWRKNLHDNDENDKINWKDGIDLNRNYEWGFGGHCQGSSSTTSAATYRGISEATEPETRAMMELGRRLRPVIYNEYHSYGEDVFYAMGCDPNSFSPMLSTINDADQSISRVIAEEYASRLVQADGGPGFIAAPYGLRVDGIGRDNHSHDSGSIAFVTEMNNSAEGGFQPNFATWRDATVIGQRPGWLWLLNRISGPAIGGHITDAITGLPIEADLALDELSLPDGRRLTSIEESGRYHILVVPGDYMLRASALGYEDAAVAVTVGESWEVVDVQLQPSDSTRLLFEDFEDLGRASLWTAGDPEDTATDGFWEWGEPKNSHSGDVPNADLQIGNPPIDRTPGLGGSAFLTGNMPGVELSDDDVDGGTTSLTSPPFDLSGWYGIEFSWQLWLRNDPPDLLDGLSVEARVIGEEWTPLGSWTDSTVTLDAAFAWVPVSVRLDDAIRPAGEVQFRFTAMDAGEDNVVEVAIDELEIRGYSLSSQGKVSGLILSWPGDPGFEWQPVPGAPDATFEIVRGDIADLSGDAGGVDLGSLTCVEPAARGTSHPSDPEMPPSGTIWFYLVRFNLGLSSGDWGTGSEGGLRSGADGCTP